MEDIMQGTGNTTDGLNSGNVPLELPTDVRWGFTREGLYAYRHYQLVIINTGFQLPSNYTCHL
jgi:hypothetical protein